MLSNFSNLESYFLLAVFAFKSKVSIQVILKMIQWRICAANQQVLILKFTSRTEKFPGFLRNRPLEKHNATTCYLLDKFLSSQSVSQLRGFGNSFHDYTSLGSISDLVDGIIPSNEIP